jgi:hypothetical protein
VIATGWNHSYAEAVQVNVEARQSVYDVVIPAPAPAAPILYPEVIDHRIADVEALARWMDYAFTLPGGFRCGLAGFIGLIPGLGDILDGLLSFYIVVRAVQLGIPRVTLTRMVVNVGIETAAGSLPFVGALFDAVFKANRRNYQLLKSSLAEPRRQSASDWLFLIVTALLGITAVAIPMFVIFEFAKHL